MEYFEFYVSGAYSSRCCSSRTPERLLEIAGENIVKQPKWADDQHCVVTTCVQRNVRWPWPLRKRRKSLSVMSLDCDGTDEMLAASHWLQTRLGINFVPIQSSPSHYWIITDLVDNTRAVLDVMAQIPGADSSHTALCRDWDDIFVRCLPKQNLALPIFPENTLQNPLAMAWYNEFQAHWESPGVEQFWYKLGLMMNIETGTMLDRASNPQFVL